MPGRENLDVETTFAATAFLPPLLLPLAPMLTRLFICACLLLPFTLNAAEVKPYPLTTCIVSGDKLDPNVPAVVHQGQQIRFCCNSCAKKFAASPDKYLIKLPKK